MEGVFYLLKFSFFFYYSVVRECVCKKINVCVIKQWIAGTQTIVSVSVLYFLDHYGTAVEAKAVKKQGKKQKSGH